MAVNGVEIAAGQIWRTRGGKKMVIERTDNVQSAPFIVHAKNEAGGGYNYTADGEWALTQRTGCDLVELLDAGTVPSALVGDEHEALTFGDLPGAPVDLGRTNPKDAVGDKKAAMHLLSPIAEIHWMIGQYAGMLKYGAWNWRAAGVRSSVYISALRRHLMAFTSGEEFDPVDGSHHLGNIMACAAILLEAQAIGKLTDDRPPRFSHRATLEWAEDRMAQLKVQYSDKTPRHFTIADSAEVGGQAQAPVFERKKADDSEGGLE